MSTRWRGAVALLMVVATACGGDGGGAGGPRPHRRGEEAVDVTTPDLTIRGLDRAGVIPDPAAAAGHRPPVDG